MDVTGTSDPYVLLECNFRRMQSAIVKRTIKPKWNETFYIDVTDPGKLAVSVWDWDMLSRDDFIGQVEIPLHQFRDGARQQRWYTLAPKPTHKKGEDAMQQAGLAIDHNLGEVLYRVHLGTARSH